MPQTSVLGHMLLVAVLSYLFARRIGACPRRRYNDFFGGLFHDLPEAVTRDVVNPVKTAVKSLPAALKRIEGELAREMILPLLEPAWHAEFEYFTGREFDDKVRVRGRTVLLGGRGIGARRNRDGCNPYDGRLVQLADQLAAFLEAYKACEMGLSIREMDEARKRIAGQYRGRTVSGIDAGALFAAFEGGRCGRGPGWPRTR
jgi:putative hydrolase of HD superfamily